MTAVARRETSGCRIASHLRREIISGAIAPGAPITEIGVAARYGVSRGPIREAMTHLAAEGLIVSVPYTGTRAIRLSSGDVREIFTLRIALETLAFREVWERRDARFADDLRARHAALLSTLALGDHVASSEAEIRFHSLVYERCGHALLREAWKNIAGRLQFYLAVHQRAHGRTGPDETAHQRYVELAKGAELEPMIMEVEDHMRRGIRQLSSFLERTKLGVESAI